MKKVKIITVICIFTMLFSVTSVYAAAYKLMDDGYYSSSFRIKNLLTDTNLVTRMHNSRSYWSTTHEDINIYSSTSTANEVSELDEPAISAQGLYCPIRDDSGTLDYFVIHINTASLPDNASDRYIEGVITHEFGHALSLDDLGFWDIPWNASTMNYYADRETVYQPQSNDIKGVKAAYNLK